MRSFRRRGGVGTGWPVGGKRSRNSGRGILGVWWYPWMQVRFLREAAVARDPSKDRPYSTSSQSKYRPNRDVFSVAR
jgi:hypothetical protein